MNERKRFKLLTILNSKNSLKKAIQEDKKTSKKTLKFFFSLGNKVSNQTDDSVNNHNRKATRIFTIRMAENENIGNPQFFEGVEKLLEIWFTPNPSNKNADLRKIPR